MTKSSSAPSTGQSFPQIEVMEGYTDGVMYKSWLKKLNEDLVQIYVDQWSHSCHLPCITFSVRVIFLHYSLTLMHAAVCTNGFMRLRLQPPKTPLGLRHLGSDKLSNRSPSDKCKSPVVLSSTSLCNSQ